MPFRKQSSTKKPMATSGSRDYPDMPQFPTDLSAESREKYNSEMQEFWSKMKAQHRSIDDDLATKQTT